MSGRPFVYAPTPPTDESRPTGYLTRDYLIRLVAHFHRRYGRVLTKQDCVGCAIAYCAFHFVPRDKRLDQAMEDGIAIRVFGNFIKIAPELLIDGGFIPPFTRGVSLLSWVLYRDWCRVFEPGRKPQTEREEVLRALRDVELFRTAEWMPTRQKEESAYVKAASLASFGSGRRRVDPAEVRNELWGKFPARALYRRADGTFKYDIQSIKDALRSPEIREKFLPISVKVKTGKIDDEGFMDVRRRKKKALELDAPVPSGEGTIGAEVPARATPSLSDEEREQYEQIIAVLTTDDDREAVETWREWVFRHDLTLEAMAEQNGVPLPRIRALEARIKRNFRPA